MALRLTSSFFSLPIPGDVNEIDILCVLTPKLPLLATEKYQYNLPRQHSFGTTLRQQRNNNIPKFDPGEERISLNDAGTMSAGMLFLNIQRIGCQPRSWPAKNETRKKKKKSLARTPSPPNVARSDKIK